MQASIKRVFAYAIIVVSVVALRTGVLSACQRFGPVVPEDMVASADLIVRATVDYSRMPTAFGRTSWRPESTVRFRIEEVVKGRYALTDLDLPGYLESSDDFNELPVPYTFVRRGGRGGSCFANTYRQGGRYLLVLKMVAGAYTVDWYALGPTNEQLHSVDDPWLKWVRSQVGPRIRSLR
ncbi:MAG TPA: hypothetical protein VNN25_26300 [Thermoanaerobaculia bacterium]|nr:hypothetical protein [Thermoanaerobaculia bacterium]